MVTDKQRFSVTVDDGLYRKIEDFRFEKRIKSQSKAVNELMRIGFEALVGKEASFGPSLSSFEIGIIEKYNSLDSYGKEIIDFILQKEYERCSASRSGDEPDIDAALEKIKMNENKGDVMDIKKEEVK